jgi:hypothetical protein
MQGLPPIRVRSNPEDLTTDSEAGSRRAPAAPKQSGACARRADFLTPVRRRLLETLRRMRCAARGALRPSAPV